MRKRKTPSYNSVSLRQTFIKATKDLFLDVHTWHNKTRITISINSPYTMSFMLDIDEEETDKLLNQLKVCLKELKSGLWKKN